MKTPAVEKIEIALKEIILWNLPPLVKLKKRPLPTCGGFFHLVFPGHSERPGVAKK
jgi:hypothetical protein